MGLPFAPLFGDKTKEELEKELKRVDADIEKMKAERADIVEALKKHDCTTKG